MGQGRSGTSGPQVKRNHLTPAAKQVSKEKASGEKGVLAMLIKNKSRSGQESGLGAMAGRLPIRKKDNKC